MAVPAERLDVLFVDLPFNTYELGHRFKEAWSYKQFLSPYELHLGFRYMCGALRANRFGADIIFPSESNGLTTRDDLARAIEEIRPRILGFTSYEGSLGESIAFIRDLRASGVDAVICMGGHLATFSYQEILRDFHDFIDVIVLGDGEQAIVELAAAVANGTPFRDIRGLALFEDGGVVRTAPRPILTDIDSLPFPILAEGEAWSSAKVPLFLTTSRGCYGHCSFCRSSHFGERWRARDPKNVVDEIEAAYARGVRTFEMVDDNFLGPGAAGKRRAVAIADELLRRHLDIRFHASCRVNDVDEPTMRTLREAGLISVSLGVESGVPRMLATFNKNVTVAQNLAALELLERLDIPTLAYMIFFDPWSTLAEARENVAFIRRIRALKTVRFELILFRKLIPISGTDVFARIREAGLLRGDYLKGHRFEFVDERVALLAEFLETIDLRFESALQDERFRAVDGMYALKESLQLDLAEKAIAWFDSARRVPRTARARLDGLLADELRRRFGLMPGRAESIRTTAGQGGLHG